MTTIQEQLKEGLALHQAGNLAGAGEVYRTVLEAEPGNVDALNLMGVVLQAGGELDTAIGLLEQAAELAPDYTAPLVNLGNALQLKGRFEDAVDTFAKALVLDPNLAEAANNLASALNDLGRHQEAADACAKALKLMPDFGEAHNNLGNALAGLGKAQEAEESYRRAVDINPGHATAYFNLGNALADQGLVEDAFDHYRKAVALDGGNAEKHYNLANTALKLDRYEEARESFENAIAIDADYLDAHCNLGSALQSLGRMEDSIASYRRALALAPKGAANDDGPSGDNADLHWNLALALLQNGDYAEGWAEYEWRWKNPDFKTPAKDVPEPLWDGGDLKGKTVLLHDEQGIGDTMQFIRYAPLAAAKGARVVVECRAELARLFAGMEGVDQVVERGGELPAFDCHAPLISLPRIFATTLDTVPNQIPYLSPPEGTPVDARIHEGGGLSVGFAWAGSQTHGNDANRSVDPDRFEPLFGVPGTRFFSLQVGGARPGFEALAPGENVFDLSPDLDDFADTAAAIEALDLVISVDTAVVHLAGALGRPVWVLVPYATSYMWLAGRDDSPWYPSLRLFRQSEPGDWDGVFDRVKEELAKLAGNGG